MAKVGDTSFFGTSRTVYRFGVYDLDSNFKDEIAAVYVLSAKNGRGQHRPLYVGETSKLGVDVSRERALPIVNGHSDATICVHLDDDEMSRKSKMSDLIAYYKPSGNSQ